MKHTLPVVADGEEMVRTSVGYGTPGGYMLTVIRADHVDGRVALLLVDNVLVADMVNCDSADARVDVYRDGGAVGPWPESKARSVIDNALAAMASLHDINAELDEQLRTFGDIFSLAVGTECVFDLVDGDQVHGVVVHNDPADRFLVLRAIPWGGAVSDPDYTHRAIDYDLIERWED